MPRAAVYLIHASSVARRHASDSEIQPSYLADQLIRHGLLGRGELLADPELLRIRQVRVELLGHLLETAASTIRVLPCQLAAQLQERGLVNVSEVGNDGLTAAILHGSSLPSQFSYLEKN